MNTTTNNEESDFELRPGGMLVQKREDSDVGVPPINLKVSHGTPNGSTVHQINLPAHSTFGDLKALLAVETGLDPRDQRLFFRGKEMKEDEFLHKMGVKDRSKMLLLEDNSSKERKFEEMKRVEEMKKACEPVFKVRAEVDKLAHKVSELEAVMRNGTKVDEKEFVVLTELLMVQLLKLDSIEAEGEVKAQRRIEVRRVQNLVETLDNMKARNANPFRDNGNTVKVSTKWEKFDNGFGSLDAPPSTSSPEVNEPWESFD